MSKQSIPYFVSVISITQQIYQTAPTCATRSSLLGKGKKILLDREVPSHERCSLPYSTWPLKKSPVDSVKTVVADWFILIRITGLRCAEYAQKTQSTFDEHEYPSGKRVIKAFISTDWKFYDSSGALTCIHTLNSELRELPKKLKVILTKKH